MLKQLLTVAWLAVLTVLLIPVEVDAYGAAHVGYTHVGPNGAYHTGSTAVAGPNGGYAGAHTTTVAGGGTSGTYAHSGYSAGGVTASPTVGTGYHPPTTTYAPSYSAGYGYVR
jgi:hypothetical protein